MNSENICIVCIDFFECVPVAVSAAAVAGTASCARVAAAVVGSGSNAAAGVATWPLGHLPPLGCAVAAVAVGTVKGKDD